MVGGLQNLAAHAKRPRLAPVSPITALVTGAAIHVISMTITAMLITIPTSNRMSMTAGMQATSWSCTRHQP